MATMTDSLTIAAPLVIAAIVMAVRFVGCAFQTHGIPGPPQTPTDYSSAVLGNMMSLVSFWRLNDSINQTGPTKAKDIRDGNDGTYQGSVSPGGATGLANTDTGNSAALFLGGYVEVPDTKNSLNPASFTVELLVQPGGIDPTNRRTIVSSFSDTAQAGYALALNNTDFEAIVGTGGATQTLPVHANAQPNQSYYVAMTYNDMKKLLELYVEPAPNPDENQLNQSEFIGADPYHQRYNSASYPYVPQVQPATKLRMGASTGGGPPAEFFQGALQDVAVYNAALSFEDIATHYWIYKTGFGTPGVSQPAAAITPPQTMEYATASTNTYPIPEWCNFIDLILLGAGGGGANAFGATAGNGGGSGSWNTQTLTRGGSGPNGIPWTTSSIGVKVGSGGPTDTNGGDTTASANGMTWKASGGAKGGNNGTTTGASPGTKTYLGKTYPPSPATVDPQNTPSAKGNPPGGGGGGAAAFSFTPGGAGAGGAAWVVARET